MSSPTRFFAQFHPDLARRFPDAIGFRAPAEKERIATGVAALDTLTEGGLPRGALTEISGSASSGRTSLLLSFLAQLTQAGESCALVDAGDALDVESAAAAGVALNRLLWVRCGEKQEASRTEPPALVESLAPSAAAAPAAPVRGRPGALCGRHHPRQEVRHLDRALAGLMGQKSNHRAAFPVTTSVPVVTCAPCSREEKLAAGYQPRRGEYFFSREAPALPPLQAEKSHPAAHAPARLQPQSWPWRRLEQALRIADLLLQAGGFGSVVLDFGGVEAAHAGRIPLASWFRFRRDVEDTRTALLLLTQEPCAKTAAALVLRCARREEQWLHAARRHPEFAALPFQSPFHATATPSAPAPALLETLHWQVEVLRMRMTPSANPQRGKPVSSSCADWSSRPWWSAFPPGALPAC
jgi:recombination protein RecA